MNYKAISYVLGKIFMVLGALLFLPLCVSIYYAENQLFSFLIPSLLLIFTGFILTVKKPKNLSIYTKEGLVICGLSWIFISAAGALPFVISKTIPNFISAFFETCSGFTTTGATVLTQIEGLPKSILFWRAFTHWIGGMGILLFMMAIIPKSESHSMFIMKAEVPGPKAGKVVSKIQESARILYIIYIAITLLEIVLLVIFTDMRFFDAVTTSFSTAGTGGFANLNDSILGYNSPAAEWIISVFMFLFAANFNLYFFLLIKKFSSAFKNEELWVYIGINISAVVLITCDLMQSYSSFSEALRNAVFNVNSIMSTTGFCTVDYNKWSSFSKTILMILMFVGGCAGSTGGGLKVSRVLIYVKEVFAELRKSIKPRSIVKIKMNGRPVEKEVITGINAYLVIYCLILVVSVFLISINGFDMETSFSAVVACFNNVGPGLSAVGPTGNYADFSIFSKLVLCIDMLAGRLEIFPILILFNPATYKK